MAMGGGGLLQYLQLVQVRMARLDLSRQWLGGTDSRFKEIHQILAYVTDVGITGKMDQRKEVKMSLATSWFLLALQRGPRMRPSQSGWTRSGNPGLHTHCVFLTSQGACPPGRRSSGEAELCWTCRVGR